MNTHVSLMINSEQASAAGVTPKHAKPSPVYLIGVDGGGTGTRVGIASAQHPERALSRATAGPSGLGLGVPQAWQAIRQAIQDAFQLAGIKLDWSRCVLACGLAGANHSPWRDAFVAAAPPRMMGLVLEGDATTTVLGAHAGRPGLAIALGTGSIGIRLAHDGTLRTVGGFGFPSGDEASGAWLGLHVVPHLQKALDCRGPMDDLALALLDAMHLVLLAEKTATSDDALRERVLHWLVNANQTAYATLAPVVSAHAGHPFAAALLRRAASDVVDMIDTLDPQRQLPLALSGSLAPVIMAFLPDELKSRILPAQGDAISGALLLANRLFRQLYP